VVKLKDKTAAFRHFGLSPAEIEIVYDTLNRTFTVQETMVEREDEKQDAGTAEPGKNQYISLLEIEFPMPYKESFFEAFTIESWFKIKGIIKEMKRRRGRKGLRALLIFEQAAASSAQESFPSVVFELAASGNRQFEMGIEKIEYIVDIVPVQLASIPARTERVWYSFDEVTYKWAPALALADGVEYMLKNNEWKTSIKKNQESK